MTFSQPYKTTLRGDLAFCMVSTCTVSIFYGILYGMLSIIIHAKTEAHLITQDNPSHQVFDLFSLATTLYLYLYMITMGVLYFLFFIFCKVWLPGYIDHSHASMSIQWSNALESISQPLIVVYTLMMLFSKLWHSMIWQFTETYKMTTRITKTYCR